MELWATGFNAFNQLDFNNRPGAYLAADLHNLRCILSDKAIEILRISETGTLVNTSIGLQIAGFQDEFTTQLTGGGTLNLNTSTAIAGNGKVAITRGGCVKQYESLYHYKHDIVSLSRGYAFQTIVANNTGFTALSSSSHVFTWGDERYANLLGRSAESSPAFAPDRVNDLVSMSVMKLSSGGSSTAVLNDQNEAYIWGVCFNTDGENVAETPIRLDLSMKVLDISVGYNHMIVLNSEREVFFIGHGESGQLGPLTEGNVLSWTRMSVPLRHGQQVRSVHAGYLNTFLIIEQLEGA